jgi:putative transposase
MKRKPYPSDLNDAEWAILEPHIPLGKSGGRPCEVDMREVINAIFYVLRSGCSWDMLPHDFPPKGTVYDYFNKWRKSGKWEQINQILREELRQKEGRETSPSAGSVDSQSVKTTEKGANVGLTAVKRSKDANATSSLIPMASC